MLKFYCSSFSQQIFRSQTDFLIKKKNLLLSPGSQPRVPCLPWQDTWLLTLPSRPHQVVEAMGQEGQNQAQLTLRPG